MRCVGLVRVSTTEQQNSGAGLAAQEALIRAEADRRGWELVSIVTETASGGADLADRPVLSQLLDQLDAGFADVLLVTKLDRLSRSVVQFAEVVKRATSKS